MIALAFLIGFASFSAARYVVNDDVFQRLRAWTNAHVAENKIRYVAFKLTHCARCLGFWLTVIITLAWTAATVWPGTIETIVLTLAATGIGTMIDTYVKEATRD